MRIFKEVDEVKNEKEFGKLAEHEEFMRSENESIRFGKLREHEEFMRSENENIKIGKLRIYK